jgi:hypothetical protein
MYRKYEIYVAEAMTRGPFGSQAYQVTFWSRVLSENVVDVQAV